MFHSVEDWAEKEFVRWEVYLGHVPTPEMSSAARERKEEFLARIYGLREQYMLEDMKSEIARECIARQVPSLSELTRSLLNHLVCRWKHSLIRQEW